MTDRDLRRGNRSLPSCLGGGDLDGDIFNLILNVWPVSSVIPKLTWKCVQPTLFPAYTVEPGAYTGLQHKTTEHGQPCSVDDIANFVIDLVRYFLTLSFLVHCFFAR